MVDEAIVKYTYLIIDLGSLAIPLAWSFGSGMSFFKKWKYLFPALALTGSLFVLWDVVFTNWGVWGFNPKYLSGVYLWNLPLEEWLFFICIPYACVFTYEALNHFLRKDYFQHAARPITLVLIVLLLAIAAFNLGRLYTSTTFLLLAFFLIIHLTLVKANYLGRFYLSYLVILLPFFLVNGILTGSFINEEVVWYNDHENLGLRMFTIPVEDTFYGMLLILINVTVFESLKTRSKGNQQLNSDSAV